MKIAGIKTCDTQNGEGIRVTLWTQGCPFRCKGCHNQETWSYDGGREFTEEDKNYIFEELKKGQEFSVLGGEPLLSRNSLELKKLLKEIKEKYPEMKIWMWTGRTWTSAKRQFRSLLYFVDVLVTERFKENELIKEPMVKEDIFKGSFNQKVVDVQKSLERKELVLYKMI